MCAKIKREVDGFKVYAPEEPGKRWQWLIGMIKVNQFTIGAEIGCARGQTTMSLLQACPKLKMIAVDLWQPVPEEVGGGRQYKDWNFKSIEQTFKERTRPFTHRLQVLKGISWEMADKVEDESLDFVFIDADHEYESVKKDIRAWVPKLKPTGILNGHDTHFPEVVKAIDELLPGWESTGVDHVWFIHKKDIKL